jgi:hypothetical protein
VSNPAYNLLLKIKVYWNTTIIIHEHGFYGCLHSPLAELKLQQMPHGLQS